MLQGKATHQKVALGMSGGVDSSVAAKLLVDAGYEVTGVYLECWRAPGCRTDQDRKDALQVALSLGIPFTVLDFKDAYRERVVEYFFQEYQAGRTPNPDVMCNKEIKFGLFYDWAIREGFDAVATGHYAQVLPVPTAPEGEGQRRTQPALFASQDSWKDQTYFLYRLTAEQLKHTLFPIGHLTKKEVRKLATEFGLETADKKDSVGICFIGDINVHEFLRERLGENPGDVVDRQGRLIGRHNGLWFYTIGQRHGFSIFPKTVTVSETGEQIDHHNIPPFYVVGKNPEKNELVVGFGRDTYQQEFTVSDLHWITPAFAVDSDQLGQSLPVLVRIRHTGQLHPAQINLQTLRVMLDEPIQGIAEGQSAVFYRQHSYSSHTPLCLGGAVIQEA
ncbi:tRNA 2-thiouridine(34) synthase MnmA [Patescibacteria group bacterium]|nr:tRNA 2-thiouridine(34) synthase MnmA [Patescibacteria group bacterium]